LPAPPRPGPSLPRPDRPEAAPQIEFDEGQAAKLTAGRPRVRRVVTALTGRYPPSGGYAHAANPRTIVLAKPVPSAWPNDIHIQGRKLRLGRKLQMKILVAAQQIVDANIRVSAKADTRTA
jgi:hypothetical protein